jgi:hypothetical protein
MAGIQPAVIGMAQPVKRPPFDAFGGGKHVKPPWLSPR